MIEFTADRPKKKIDLEREFTMARLDALEAEEKKRNPAFKPPDPPAGLKPPKKPK